MKTLILLIIDGLAMLFFATLLTSLLVNSKEVLKGHPWLFRNQLFLMITGLAMMLVIVLFALGAIMWEQPVQYYEQIMEPIYRLKQ